MAYSYIFLATAQEEYESSVEWYYDRSLSAANNFIDAIDSALELICAHPDRWRNEYHDYYELGLSKFPFSIIYTIEAESVVVTSIIIGETLEKSIKNNLSVSEVSIIFLRR